MSFDRVLLALLLVAEAAVAVGFVSRIVSLRRHEVPWPEIAASFALLGVSLVVIVAATVRALVE